MTLKGKEDFEVRCASAKLFAGQYYDSETGLHYNYFRTYDPATGRYERSDPIGLAGGLNTYAYANNNPIYYTDPYGENVLSLGRLVGQVSYAGATWGLNALGWTATITAGGVALYDLINNPPGYFNEDASDDSNNDEPEQCPDKTREKGERLTDSDSASDQYEDIQKEQNRRRQQGDNVSIESIKKSKQRDKTALKPWNLDY